MRVDVKMFIIWVLIILVWSGLLSLFLYGVCCWGGKNFVVSLVGSVVGLVIYEFILKGWKR